MPDERLDSMRQGIGAPPESPAAQKADAERREQIVRDPAPVPMESAMGGTSDAGGPADDVDADAILRAGLSPTGGDASAGDRSGESTPTGTGLEGDVARETREAGLRAQGGGSSDEDDIRRSSRG
jgi:hypothetical protein